MYHHLLSCRVVSNPGQDACTGKHHGLESMLDAERQIEPCG